MCPLTICPQVFFSKVNALSKFTLSPTLSFPKLLLLKVSSITSASKQFPFIFVTVRHTPLVAMLSPINVFSKTF